MNWLSPLEIVWLNQEPKCDEHKPILQALHSLNGLNQIICGMFWRP